MFAAKSGSLRDVDQPAQRFVESTANFELLLQRKSHPEGWLLLRPAGVYGSRWVVSVILALLANNFETGQPAFALLAASSNFSCIALGIFAVRSR
jgi:hypothetical protein